MAQPNKNNIAVFLVSSFFSSFVISLVIDFAAFSSFFLVFFTRRSCSSGSQSLSYKYRMLQHSIAICIIHVLTCTQHVLPHRYSLVNPSPRHQI